MLVPKEERDKLHSKTQACLLVGYDKCTKAYRLYKPERKKILVSQDVVFDESCVGYHQLTL